MGQLIRLPDSVRVAYALEEPAIRHQAPTREETVLYTGRSFWRGTVEIGRTDRETFPTKRGPNVQIGDRIQVPLGDDPAGPDIASGPSVTGSDATGWTLDADLPATVRAGDFVRAGPTGRLVQVEEVVSVRHIRVFPVLTGAGRLYRVTAIYAKVTSRPDTVRDPNFAGPWVYGWEEVGATAA